MQSPIPAFVLGYHGCDALTAEEVLAGRQTLKFSQNDYDWLGDGVYFWENNAARAFDFACEMARRPHPSGQKIQQPAVVGAVIDLGNCLNLLDSGSIRLVKSAYDMLHSAAEASGVALARNAGGPDRVDRQLDCAVIRALHRQRADTAEADFDTVRAVFLEGQPLYADAGFLAKTHIQIAVRRPGLIKGYFRPLVKDGKPMSFPAV